MELCEEYCRRGNFEMIFPRKNSIEKYRKYFKVQRACNTIIWKWLKLGNSVSKEASSPEKKGSKSANKLAESRNLQDAHNTHGHKDAGNRSRFSVLKDFKVRGNCAKRYIDDIK